jgi:CHAT domain/SIR2-like domain
MAQDPVASGRARYPELLIRVEPRDRAGDPADRVVCRVVLTYTPPGAEALTQDEGEVTLDLAELRDARPDPAEYGRLLAEAFFADATVRKDFGIAFAMAAAQEQQLRLRLEVDTDAPELHALRWETLRGPDGQEVLATSERLLFSRYLRSPDWARVASRPEQDVRALVVIANPSNLATYSPEGVPLAPIDTDAELARVTRALGRIPVTALASPGAATLDNLVRHVRQGYDIVYLVCHGAFVGGQARLYLERPSGETTTVTGDELAAELEQLRRLPSLVVLASCQSAGSGGGGALSAVGPRLARVGVPVVLAMQERISVETCDTFMETFFEELVRDWQVDRAAAIARSRVRHQADFWVPVLYSRLIYGSLRPQMVDDEGDAPWPALLSHIRKGDCTAIVGPGLLEFLLGSSHEIARRWADQYRFPMSPHDRQDLPQVAQFLAVNQADAEFPADELMRYLQGEIIARYGELSEDSAGQTVEEQVSQLVSEVGRRRRARDEAEPYRVLANLPLSIYITTNPLSLLADALREAGKDPVVQVCCWDGDSDAATTPDADYEPTPERPLVYHVFGQLGGQSPLVLTEDNYFDYLLRVGKEPWRIPQVVRTAWNKNVLLFLGFQADDWNFRVLFRMVMSEEGRLLGNRKPHVAVQLNPEEGTSTDPFRAREYLKKYFGDEHISIYWGSVEQFFRSLWYRWRQPAQPRAA